jgi:hypothetical protein
MLWRTDKMLGPAPLSKGERGVEGLPSASWRSSISRSVGLLSSQGVNVRAFSATPCSACKVDPDQHDAIMSGEYGIHAVAAHCAHTMALSLESCA